MAINLVEDAEAPNGVELYDMEDASLHRNLIFQDAQDEIQKQFPKSHNGVVMSLSNVGYDKDKDFTLSEQKKALHDDRYLAKKLNGTVTLTDENTGQVLDQKHMTLMRVPYLTERHTFIKDGNEWGTVAQQRLLPGAYSRVQSNGKLETQFNVRPGTGGAFRVSFDPESSQYKMHIKGGEIHLYSLLHAMGVSDETLEKQWGPDVLAANQAKYDSKNLDKAYTKVVPEWGRGKDKVHNDEEKVKLVQASLDRAQVSKDVIESTLPSMINMLKYSSTGELLTSGQLVRGMAPPAINRKEVKGVDSFELDNDGREYMGVGVNGLVASSSKLLAINRGEEDTDERDSLRYQKVLRFNNMMREGIKMDAGKTARTLMYQVAKQKTLKPLGTRPFESYVSRMMSGNPLTTPLEEINPLQLVESARRITRMGPGGLASSQSITTEAQNVHPSQFGFISVIDGPESERAGIDVRAAWGTRIGSDGNLYQKMRDRRTNKLKWICPRDAASLTIRMPD